MLLILAIGHGESVQSPTPQKYNFGAALASPLGSGLRISKTQRKRQRTTSEARHASVYGIRERSSQNQDQIPKRKEPVEDWFSFSEVIVDLAENLGLSWSLQQQLDRIGLILPFPACQQALMVPKQT
jgi:hypothetical protein